MRALLIAIFVGQAILPVVAFGQAGLPVLHVPDAQQFVGAPQGPPLTGAPLEQRTNEIGALLRCPVCQGMSIADSPAEMAINMRRQVHELLARGYTREQILHYFERSYGQFVLLKPKFQGVNTLVWLLPIVALIVGASIIVAVMTKRAPPPAVVDAEEGDDPYLDQVRQLTRGKES
jgi:cytochrome c-type biogenesis protein CcmH